MKELDIYKKLKVLRKERGLTLANLADKIGSDYQQLSRIERGKSRLTVDVFMKMARALDTPIDELVNPQVRQGAATITTTAVLPAAVCGEKLGEILEKLEETLQSLQIQLLPQAKAGLASLIYTEALTNPSAIEFAMNIVRALSSVKK